MIKLNCTKVLDYHRKRADDTYPVVIRITIQRFTSYISTGVSVITDHWDKKNGLVVGKESEAMENKTISEIYNRVASIYHEFKVQKIEPTAAQIKKKFISEAEVGQNTDVNVNLPIPANQESKSSGALFFPYVDIYLKGLKATQKFSQYDGEKPRFKVLKEFAQDPALKFEDITVEYLRTFIGHLKTKRKRMCERTVMNYMICIRTVFNRAIEDKLVEASYYPFGKGKNKIKIKLPETSKIGLDEQEVIKIEELVLEPDTDIWHARNLWLLSFYFAGIRVGDIVQIKWAEFINGRIHYEMGKNKKQVDLKIPEPAEKILEMYRPYSSKYKGYVFPYLIDVDLTQAENIYKEYRKANSSINTYLDKIVILAGINKHIAMHISRHTFAQIAGDKIPLPMLQKLYRHSNITTTMGYQSNFQPKQTDDALDSVLNFKRDHKKLPTPQSV
jgi:integrase